ncbi:hypothetical protein ABIE64_003356 [Thalassospira sp. MBR-102]|jgi:hypothetical protein|nr:hypothetical protein SAMN02744133_102165 [Thalassospira xiamenensis M-5 = DSM 17429]
MIAICLSPDVPICVVVPFRKDGRGPAWGTTRTNVNHHRDKFHAAAFAFASFPIHASMHKY